MKETKTEKPPPRKWTPDPRRHPVRLPADRFVIDGQVHVPHWRSDYAIVLQNYSASGQKSMFKAFRIEHLQHGEGAAIQEMLGELLGTFSELNAAINLAAKQSP